MLLGFTAFSLRATIGDLPKLMAPHRPRRRKTCPPTFRPS